LRTDLGAKKVPKSSPLDTQNLSKRERKAVFSFADDDIKVEKAKISYHILIGK